MIAVRIAGPARADVSPGDKITDKNMDKLKDLISPGMEWCVKHGWPITIAEPKRIEWPKAYKEATEKYSGQVKLTPDGLDVKNYVAGLPFPNLDPKDPQIAYKIMWNYSYQFLSTDDVDLRNFDADTGSIADHGRGVGATSCSTISIACSGTGVSTSIPSRRSQSNGYRAQQGLYQILEPFDLKGVSALGNRYIDLEADDSWLYLPSLRRVRRLSPRSPSGTLFDQATDVDSYYGYARHTAWMDWKYLGEKEVIGAFHAKNYPVKWDEKVDWAFDDVWEKRKVYVIEGVSKLPQYAYSKRVLFIDKEGWVMPFTDIYDRSGDSGRSGSTTSSFQTTVPGSGAITYSDEMGFVPAS
jgi:hypothetical protein